MLGCEDKLTLTDYIVTSLLEEIGWERIEIPGAGSQPGWSIGNARVAIRLGLIAGGGIGVQFPEKVIQIYKEIHPEDADGHLKAEEEQITKWFAGHEKDTASLTLEDLGDLTTILNNNESAGVKWISQAQACDLIFSYFLYGCVFGALHSKLFLQLLTTSVEKENFHFRLLADIIPPELAGEQSVEGLLEAAREAITMAYVRRGLNSADLEHQLAIDDFDEAIRLDPECAAAYVGRAVTYTLLGNDLDARRDSERAIQLGAERGSLESSIKEIRRK